jgi:hypothetical protein
VPHPQKGIAAHGTEIMGDIPRWKSGHAADITAKTDFGPQAVFGCIHRTCLSPLVTDRVMEVWYNPSIA